MDITTILTNPITWLVLALLHAACWAYAYGIVRRMRRSDPNHGQTAWLVVIGNSAIGATLFAIAWITIGLTNAIGLLILLLLANLAAGVPMIVEYVGDHINHSRQNSDRNIAMDVDDIAALADLIKPEATAPMNTRHACTQALEHLDALDDLIDVIFPIPTCHSQAQKTEAKLTTARTLIYNRLAAIEDGLTPNPHFPVPSPHNATLSQQEDEPTCST